MNSVSENKMHSEFKIGGRVGFDRIEELEHRFCSIDFPIELALPWKYQELWLPIEEKVGRVIEFFKGRDIEILSIHATQGRITEEAFLRWGELTIEIAEALGAGNITVHPNNVKSQREWSQEQSLKHIQEIGGEDIISIETFGGRNRVFKPHELIEKGIPMTLDTAHLHKKGIVIDIVNSNHQNIQTVHLSSIGKSEHHLPIDQYCREIVDRLAALQWYGNVILEYLPWHHYRIRDDIRALQRYLEDGGALELMPVSDQFRDDPDHYGYNSDGTN